jgi:hypothetical protein
MAPDLMRFDDIVPFAMKSIGMKIDSFHLFWGDFATGGIFAAIQSADHGQSFRGRRLGDEMDDGFVVTQRLATPIRRDKGCLRAQSLRQRRLV